MTVDIKDKPFFCLWSGGKDCCLSLYRAIDQGGQPQLLFTLFDDQFENSYNHRLSRDIIYAQAKSLNLPIEIAEATEDDYEKTFLSSLENFKSLFIDFGVFGGTDVIAESDWNSKVCSKYDIEACYPLSDNNSKDLLTEFLDLGFEAIIIAVKDEVLDTSYLGRHLNKSLIEELELKGVDVWGKNGEYHTLVIAGPLFSKRINIIPKEIHSINGTSYLNLDVNI